MKTCSFSEAKDGLGELADRALHGNPTVIERDGKFVILQAYEMTEAEKEFDRLIQEGKESGSRPLTPEVWAEIWQKGKALA